MEFLGYTISAIGIAQLNEHNGYGDISKLQESHYVLELQNHVKHKQFIQLPLSFNKNQNISITTANRRLNSKLWIVKLVQKQSKKRSKLVIQQIMKEHFETKQTHYIIYPNQLANGSLKLNYLIKIS
jgi:hypothetical protein